MSFNVERVVVVYTIIDIDVRPGGDKHFLFRCGRIKCEIDFFEGFEETISGLTLLLTDCVLSLKSQ